MSGKGEDAVVHGRGYGVPGGMTRGYSMPMEERKRPMESDYDSSSSSDSSDEDKRRRKGKRMDDDEDEGEHMRGHKGKHRRRRHGHKTGSRMRMRCGFVSGMPRCFDLTNDGTTVVMQAQNGAGVRYLPSVTTDWGIDVLPTFQVAVQSGVLNTGSLGKGISVPVNPSEIQTAVEMACRDADVRSPSWSNISASMSADKHIIPIKIVLKRMVLTQGPDIPITVSLVTKRSNGLLCEWAPGNMMRCNDTMPFQLTKGSDSSMEPVLVYKCCESVYNDPQFRTYATHGVIDLNGIPTRMCTINGESVMCYEITKPDGSHFVAGNAAEHFLLDNLTRVAEVAGVDIAELCSTSTLGDRVCIPKPIAENLLRPLNRNLGSCTMDPTKMFFLLKANQQVVNSISTRSGAFFASFILEVKFFPMPLTDGKTMLMSDQ